MAASRAATKRVCLYPSASYIPTCFLADNSLPCLVVDARVPNHLAEPTAIHHSPPFRIQHPGVSFPYIGDSTSARYRLFANTPITKKDGTTSLRVLRTLPTMAANTGAR